MSTVCILLISNCIYLKVIIGLLRHLYYCLAASATVQVALTGHTRNW